MVKDDRRPADKSELQKIWELLPKSQAAYGMPPPIIPVIIIHLPKPSTPSSLDIMD